MVMERYQRLDDVARTLGFIINAKMSDTRHKMEFVNNLPNIFADKIANLVKGVEHAGQMLNSLGYKNVLARGYAIARDANNVIISSTSEAKHIVSIEFADGVATIK